MARRSPEDRAEKLVCAATRVFIEQGYRRTQVADVAEALGVAKGTIYLAVESKEALFDLALRYADEPKPFANPPKLPVPTPRPGATLRFVREKLASHRIPPTLAAAPERRPRDVAAELEQIVCELYDVLAANRRGIKLIDRCAPDYPELAALWFTGARGGLVDLLASYLADRIRAGRLRAVPDPRLAARFVIETAVYWAVHRHWDAHPEAVDEAVARATVVRFVVGALVPEKRNERRKEKPR